MSETKNNKDNDNQVNSAPYTKAGLASKSDDSTDKGENDNAGKEGSGSTEQTPKISKEKSTERDHERPIH